MNLSGVFIFYGAAVLTIVIKSSFTGVISVDEKFLLGFFIIMLNIEGVRCDIRRALNNERGRR